MEAQVDGGSNSHIFTNKDFFHVMIESTGIITHVTGDPGHYTGICIVLERIGNIIIPLYPSYLMVDNPQNTISTTAIKQYNEYRSVRTETLEWVKFPSAEGQSTRVPIERKTVEKDVLDYIKIDIMKTTTQQKYQE